VQHNKALIQLIILSISKLSMEQPLLYLNKNE